MAKSKSITFDVVCPECGQATEFYYNPGYFYVTSNPDSPMYSDPGEPAYIEQNDTFDSRPEYHCSKCGYMGEPFSSEDSLYVTTEIAASLAAESEYDYDND